MRRVPLSAEAQRQFEALPTVVKARVAAIFERLRQWPNVSGVRWLRGKWAGYGRLRTGDYRIILHRSGSGITVVRILHRSVAYEE